MDAKEEGRWAIATKGKEPIIVCNCKVWLMERLRQPFAVVIRAAPEQKQTTRRNAATPGEKKAESHSDVQTTAQENAVSGHKNIINSFGTVFTLLFLKESAPSIIFGLFFSSVMKTILLKCCSKSSAREPTTSTRRQRTLTLISPVWMGRLFSKGTPKPC